MRQSERLPQAPLGATGITVTRLSAGGHFTNGPKGHKDIERRTRELNHMIDSGITYFDVQWEPEEEAMAPVLKARGDEITVAWPLHGGTPKDPQGLCQYTLDYCDGHQRRFGIEHVDILLCVGLELAPDTQDAVMNELRTAFAHLKEAGFCDHLAFSCHHSPGMAAHAISSFDDFAVMMIPYGALDPAGAEVLALARSKGIGTVGMKPFVGGEGLFNRVWVGHPDLPSLDQWKGSGRPFQAAIKWVLADPNLDCTAPGMHSMGEVDELIAAALEPLTAEDEEILARFGQAQAEHGGPLTWEFLHPWLAVGAGAASAA